MVFVTGYLHLIHASVIYQNSPNSLNHHFSKNIKGHHKKCSNIREKILKAQSHQANAKLFFDVCLFGFFLSFSIFLYL